MNRTTLFGKNLFRLLYDSISRRSTVTIEFILLLESEYYSTREQIEENVELIVATPLRIFFEPDLALSKAASITLSIVIADSGTQRVFPLLAIICNKILVAMLLKLFFLKVA